MLSEVGWVTSFYSQEVSTKPLPKAVKPVKISDSYLGRFLQPDTLIPDLSNPQNLNRYSYVSNRPVNFNDPTGHCGDPITGTICLVGLAEGIAAIGEGIAVAATATAAVLSSPVVVTALVVTAVVVGGVLIYQNHVQAKRKQNFPHENDIKEMEAGYGWTANSPNPMWRGSGGKNNNSRCGIYCKFTIAGLGTSMIAYLAYHLHCSADEETCTPPTNPTPNSVPTLTPTNTPTNTPASTSTSNSVPTLTPTNTSTNTPASTSTSQGATTSTYSSLTPSYNLYGLQDIE